MAMKYVFVLGSAVSDFDKGVPAASLGRLLKARGYHVTLQRFTPYFNVDPGRMNPTINGEVFVTDDGAETEQDIGHYERFLDERLMRVSNVTAGRIYRTVLDREHRGDFGGVPVRLDPHITGEVKRLFSRGADKIAIIEIGGGVCELETQVFLKAVRQFRDEVGQDNGMILLLADCEEGLAPTQACVEHLRTMGMTVDAVLYRSAAPVEREALAQCFGVKAECVARNEEAENLYQTPLLLEKAHLAQIVLDSLGLEQREPELQSWREMCERQLHPNKRVDIALVGKYIKLHDAYLSVTEALDHAGFAHDAQVNVHWIDAETITNENAAKVFKDMSGILVPGGFGVRGSDGMLAAIRYARENKVPYLGICLGMQLVVIEFARNVAKLLDAHSIELMPDTPHPVIHLIAEREGRKEISGMMRLGSYPCQLDVNSKVHALYGSDLVHERHRHRYEVNSDYRPVLEDAGLRICGTSPDNRIAEMCELPNHPFFVAAQAHPEFNSRPNRPHPLFLGFIEASVCHKNEAL